MFRGLTFELQTKHHDRVHTLDRPVHVMEDLGSEQTDARRHHGRRTADPDPGAHGGKTVNV